MLFINLSNHPTKNWSEEQLSAAEQIGQIIDLPFPEVEPEMTTNDIIHLAQQLFQQIQTYGDNTQVTLHIMGEMTLCYQLINICKQAGYTCLASTTKRETYYQQDGSKVSAFHFVQFREY